MILKKVISIEGPNYTNFCLVRELAIYDVQTGNVEQHFFDPPPNLCLSETDQKTDFYSRSVLGGFGLHTPVPQPALPYDRLYSYITALGGYRLFCAGNVAHRWLQSVLPYGDIVDIQQTSEFKYPKNLVPVTCEFNHKNNRYCSKGKLMTVVYYLKNRGEI